MIADDRGSQIADRRRSQRELFPYNRRRSQAIAEPTAAYISAIVCDHDRRIADDRRSVFPYNRRRSQNILRSAIRDRLRSYGNQPLVGASSMLWTGPWMSQ